MQNRGVVIAAVGAAALAGGWWFHRRSKHREPVFVINGFYMAMRDKYTQAGGQIQYYTVEWDPKRLSWADFRSKLLGATDPTKASSGSLRAAIYSKWKELGLKSQPDVGDNAVHASASPFEAMVERLNWLQTNNDIKGDPFGKALIESGLPEATIMQWTKDPQVQVDGKKVSVFDALEDLDAQDCINKALRIAGVSQKAPVNAINQGFVFIKPHAMTPQVRDLVLRTLKDKDIRITSESIIPARTIDEHKLIDNHYYSIAAKASLQKPSELNVPEDKRVEFQNKFGVDWHKAVTKGKVYNAVEFCKKYGITGEQLTKMWAQAKDNNDMIKFGGGFYCAKINPSS